MDNEVLVSDFNRLLEHVERAAGPVALLMLISHDTTTEMWTVLCSAAGFDTKRYLTAVQMVTQAVRDSVNATFLRTIIRVSILPTDDPFVTAMNRAFHLTNSAMELRETNISGFAIPAAVVFHSVHSGVQKVATG